MTQEAWFIGFFGIWFAASLGSYIYCKIKGIETGTPHDPFNCYDRILDARIAKMMESKNE